MAEQLERYVCSIVKAGRGCGSGLVFQFEQTFWSKLLQESSCLLQKYGDGAFGSRRFYVLLTAHSNIYGQDKGKEQSVKKYIEEGEISLAFGDGSSGRRLALRDCVARTTEDGSGRCVAVTCCDTDSILVLGSQNVSLGFTLKSHSSPENCSIDSNFLLLFLSAEVVDKHLAEFIPPSLGEPKVAELAELGAEMLWQDEPGVVQKKDLALLPTHSRHVETQSLAKKIEQARKLQTIDVTTEMAESSCYIGAPIVHKCPGGTLTIIGFYCGQNKMTTIYGIFSLLKGGVEFFLAAINAKQTTSTSTLMLSRWEYHITGFLKEIHTRQSILDLLHSLLYKDEVRQVRMLECDLKGEKREILVVLNILTSIFHRYKDLEKENPTEALAKPCEEGCRCLWKIKKILKQFSYNFAKSDGQNSDIAEALFQCVEKMQHFNYIDIGEETLKEIRKDLDELGMKNSSAAINESFKWIDILDRKRAREHASERAHNSSGQQATDNEPGSSCFV